jgi:hypothetical protein
MSLKRTSRSWAWAAAAGAALVVVGVLVGRAGEVSESEPAGSKAIPVDSRLAYKVEYLGITCGHMTLESWLEDYRGKPAYHIIMTARNSSFFNKIYRVDGRIESWVDVETMSTLAYTSDITEKGKRKIKRYTIDREAGMVRAEKHGKVENIAYDGGPALDPLAFVFRGRALAGKPGTSFTQPILTDRGPVETKSNVGELKRFKTADGKRELLPVQPAPAEEGVFSRKGEFVYWIDPGPDRKLYRLDAKLGWGRLKAKLIGPADEVADRRGIEEAGE